MRYSVIYTRVSTLNQKNFGVSHSVQEKECTLYSEANGLRIRSINRETGSGFKGSQRVLKMTLSSMNKGEVLVVYDASRFTRNFNTYTSIIRMIEKKKIVLVFVKSLTGATLKYPEDRNQMTREILQAQQESENLSRKMKDVHSYLKRNGYSKSTYGIKLVKEGDRFVQEKVPLEQAVIEKFRKEGLRILNSGATHEEMITRLLKGITSTPIKYRGGRGWKREDVINVYNIAIDTSPCKKCDSSEGEMLFCDVCYNSFHLSCVGLRSTPENWTCESCISDVVFDFSKITF